MTGGASPRQTSACEIDMSRVSAHPTRHKPMVRSCLFLGARVPGTRAASASGAYNVAGHRLASTHKEREKKMGWTLADNMEREARHYCLGRSGRPRAIPGPGLHFFSRARTSNFGAAESALERARRSGVGHISRAEKRAHFSGRKTSHTQILQDVVAF